MVDFARVQKELQECNKDIDVSGISIKPKGDNLTHLAGTIPGPLATPYEGGTFNIDIILPDGYPFEPPRMQFATKVWEYQAGNNETLKGLLVTTLYIASISVYTPAMLCSVALLHMVLTRHPNISSQSGAICLDILKDQWSPALTLKTALLSVQALLSAPEPDDPQDAVVAQQYLRDYQTFAATARYWTETFARTSALGVEEKVQKLVEMGFPEALVRSTLESVGGDENMALEKLCSG
ncbi:hypothetical protein HYC85_004499 [Camellia sinensis]|uniref:E2 ubiquitin-conjugating enzyme n=1 Tax=Camellia sinensis TaxID=4442 RepID=A0A7J7HYT6_CAMSI|nr:hypothetical protein HYC85_004499 [Camellia sinensis]